MPCAIAHETHMAVSRKGNITGTSTMKANTKDEGLGEELTLMSSVWPNCSGFGPNLLGGEESLYSALFQ